MKQPHTRGQIQTSYSINLRDPVTTLLHTWLPRHLNASTKATSTSGNHRVVVVGGVANRDVPTDAANCCPHHHPCLLFLSSATLQEQSSHAEHYT